MAGLATQAGPNNPNRRQIEQEPVQARPVSTDTLDAPRMNANVQRMAAVQEEAMILEEYESFQENESANLGREIVEEIESPMVGNTYGRNKRKTYVISSDEEEDEDDVVVPPPAPQPGPSSRKPASSVSQSTAAKFAYSSDEDEIPEKETNLKPENTAGLKKGGKSGGSSTDPDMDVDFDPNVTMVTKRSTRARKGTKAGTAAAAPAKTKTTATRGRKKKTT